MLCFFLFVCVWRSVYMWYMSSPRWQTKVYNQRFPGKYNYFLSVLLSIPSVCFLDLIFDLIHYHFKILTPDEWLRFTYIGPLVSAFFINPFMPGAHKSDIGKQCTHISDASERVVWSGCKLFALKMYKKCCSRYWFFFFFFFFFFLGGGGGGGGGLGFFLLMLFF